MKYKVNLKMGCGQSLLIFVAKIVIVCVSWIPIWVFLPNIIVPIIMVVILIIIFASEIIRGYQDSRIAYPRSISNAYAWSIRAALNTEHPEGIIYILENTLKQLQQLGINYLPYKKSIGWIDEDGINRSEVRGFPNQSSLRNAIKIAQEVSRKWNEINSLGGEPAQIQAMDAIKSHLLPEDMFLDWEQMKVKRGQKIYWFDYTEEDHQAVTGLNNNPPPPPIPNIPKLPVNNPPSPPSQRVLTFEEFLQQHLGLLYLTKPEQREEYHKYLSSMGVQPPSSTSHPYYLDNSNSVKENKEDDSVW